MLANQGPLTRRDLLAAGGAAALLGLLPNSARAAPESPEAFAEYLVEAIEVIQEAHIKVTKRQELAAWAVRGLYRSIGEKLPRELEARLAGLLEPTLEEMKKLFADARRPLGKREELSELRDVDLAFEGIFRQLEPGMEQRPQRDAGFICILRSWYPTNIGLKLIRDKLSGELRVFTPLKDTPAHKAGLLPGDVIKSILNEEPDGLDTKLVEKPASELSTDQAHELLPGKPGTRIVFTIERARRRPFSEIAVTRPDKEVDPETVFGVSRKADLSWEHFIDTRSGIAYIRLTQFGKLTERDFLQALDGVAKSGAKGLLLDLRFSPGGYLDATVEMADALVDEGVLVHIRPREGKGKVFKAEKGVRLDVPVVCLVNGETGKAAEVLAAALQDNGRAAIAGERTTGAVGVWNILPLPKSGGEIKLTTAVFVRPNGKNLSKLLTNGREDEDWGVRPDEGLAVRLAPVERKLLFEHLDEQTTIPPPKWEKDPNRLQFEDRQLRVVLEHLRKKLGEP